MEGEFTTIACIKRLVSDTPPQQDTNEDSAKILCIHTRLQVLFGCMQKLEVLDKCPRLLRIGYNVSKYAYILGYGDS